MREIALKVARNLLAPALQKEWQRNARKQGLTELQRQTQGEPLGAAGGSRQTRPEEGLALVFLHVPEQNVQGAASRSSTRGGLFAEWSELHGAQ